jgi:phosphopantetheinyl transferase
VDVEHVRTDVEALQIAGQQFHPREVEFIASGKDAAEQAYRFTRIWTRKEAVLKATGAGISDDMRSFDVSQGDKIALGLKSADGIPVQTNFILQDIAIDESVLATLAGPDRTWAVKRSNLNVATLLQSSHIVSQQSPG